MSGSQTITLPAKKSKDTRAEQHPPSSVGVCCEKIREAAYHKWEAAGCPCGDGVGFWLQAEAELIAETQPEGNKQET